MTDPIYNPGQPYIIPIPGGFSPGRIAHITGAFSIGATSLVFKFQTGPYGDPNDEIGMCVYARLQEGVLGMNTFTRTGGWDREEGVSCQTLVKGQTFEFTILSDPYNFKVAANGQHLGEYSHRMDPSCLSHLNIVSGANDLTLHCIWIEDPSRAQPMQPPNQAHYASSTATPLMMGGVAQPHYIPPGQQSYSPPGQQSYLPPGQQSYLPPGQQSYPPPDPGFGMKSHSRGKGEKGLMGMINSAGAAVTGALGSSGLLGKSKGGYAPSHPQYGAYQAPPGPQMQYGPPGNQPYYGGYPSAGQQKSGGGGILNKAMAVGGGVLGAKAMSKGVGGLGGLGGGKALKYGVPLAGAGLGGYMLSKGIGKSFDFDGSFDCSDSD